MGEAIFVAERILNRYDELESQIKKSCEITGLDEDARSAKTVFIKPNLTYPEFKKGVTTRVEFIKALVSVLKKINPEISIIIGEGEGGYNSFSMSEAMKRMGFFELEKEYSKVKIVNLSRSPEIRITINTLKGSYSIALPKLFFSTIDFSISCPVPKIHAMTKVSLSYKNQWGCLPDTLRLRNHYMFNYIVSKIAEVLKFRYAFLDGRYGLTNNGPMMGDPIEADWFAASNSLGVFDMLVAEMMGIKWQKVGHLRIAARYGFLPERKNIRVVGTIEALKKSFVLRRNFWNFPALAAFHSKHLTHLFYLSKLAKPLHDIMYIFRKKPVP